MDRPWVVRVTVFSSEVIVPRKPGDIISILDPTSDDFKDFRQRLTKDGLF